MTGWKTAGFLALLVAAGGCTTPAQAKSLTLVRDGAAAATIVLAEKPTRAAQLAALEIQEHVRLITDATLPIVSENTTTTGVRICVGRTRHSPDDFKSQEYAVLFKPDSIVLVGKDNEDYGKVEYWIPGIEGAYNYPTWPDLFDEKGTLHAAYDFLEKSCGVRWFDQSEFGTDVPRNRTLTVTAKNLRRTPAFRYLGPQYTMHNMESYNREVSLWTVRWSESTPRYQEWLNLIYEKGRKLPACQHPHRWLGYERSQVFAFLTRRKLGGEAFVCNHSFYDWYDRFWEQNPKNPAAFVERHPDWFAQGYPEAKVPPQLCYSNPEVVRQCVADARENFALPEEERTKKYSRATGKFWAVVPMDNSSYCKCPACQKLGPAERVTTRDFSNGDHSRMVWGFVNQVAGELKKSNPDKLVSALAYSTYAYRPPDMSIADNIAVQMCLFPVFAATSPEGLAKDDMILKQWSDGRPLYLWLYAGLTTGHKTAVPVFPHPLGELWAGLLRKYRQAGVRGIFLNGTPQESDAYFLYKLVDDPSQNAKALMDDYFLRMYGPKAGKTVREFYDLTQAIFANPRNHSSDAKGPELDWGVLGTGPRMEKLEALVKQAETELADAPELWRKRFALFKFGTWDYMKEGRAAYEKGKVAKAAAPLAVTCPFGEDYQSFGGFNGWAKDNGDFSLRKISSALRHDGQRLYLRFEERALDRKPARGDSWELLIGKTHRLFADAAGTVTGQVQGEGAPQEWADHGARAMSTVTDKMWVLELSLPMPATLLDKGGTLVLNCRRNDATGEDNPVLVPTGGQFDAGTTGASLAFDAPLTGDIRPPPAADLLLDWDFAGDGEVVRDRSGHGNDGRLIGGKRVQGAVEFTDGNQYVEIPAVNGISPRGYTATCWLFYTDARRPGGLWIFTRGNLRCNISLPHQKLGFLNLDADGKVLGAGGPFGVEIPPLQWHMFSMTNDGEKMAFYQNGRLRCSYDAKKLEPTGPDTTWRFGGSPKLPPWYTFLGKLCGIQFYNRPLSPQEILGKYQTERLAPR